LITEDLKTPHQQIKRNIQSTYFLYFVDVTWHKIMPTSKLGMLLINNKKECLWELSTSFISFYRKKAAFYFRKH
jgi:hypothetical protein